MLTPPPRTKRCKTTFYLIALLLMMPSAESRRGSLDDRGLRKFHARAIDLKVATPGAQCKRVSAAPQASRADFMDKGRRKVEKGQEKFGRSSASHCSPTLG